MFHPRIVLRDVTNSVDYNTVIACLAPGGVLLGHTSNYIACRWSVRSQAVVLGLLNSLVFDWQARRYVDKHLSHFILRSLRVPRYDSHAALIVARLAARLSCVDDRFAEFAAGAGVECGPQSETERANQRAEIDASVAHAYGLTADDLAFMFTDYPDGAFSSEYKELVMAKYESA